LDSRTGPVLFRITSDAREFVLQEGTDQRYGARHLKRAIERYVVSPLARLLATAQVRSGDVLLIDRHSGEKGLAFVRETDQRSSYAQRPFVASSSMQLETLEVRGC
jgi:ATP-dependent Clp protease ATP-binding subunit ClpB